MHTRETIRKMTPIARKVAHICREVHSIQVHLDNLTDLVQDIELENRAYEKAQQARNERKEKHDEHSNATEP